MVTFAFNSGSYDGEISFEITDPVGTSLTGGVILAPAIDGVFLVDSSSQSICLPPACTAPSALTAFNITTTSADISWTAGGTETAWNLEWGELGGTMTTVAVTDSSYSFSGLTADTDYEYYVQADCGGDTSLFAGPFTFTTLPLPSCNYYVDMYDSFGDGWNGATIEASVNGVVTKSFGLTSGNYSLDSCKNIFY